MTLFFWLCITFFNLSTHLVIFGWKLEIRWYIVVTLNSVLFFWELLFLCLLLLLVFSHSVVANSLRPQDYSAPGFPVLSLSLGVCSNSCTLSQWWYPTISFSVIPFSSNLLSFPASGSFPVSQLFPSGVLIIGASTSASALSMNACFSSWLTFLVSKCKILYLCDGFTLWSLLNFLQLLSIEV